MEKSDLGKVVILVKSASFEKGFGLSKARWCDVSGFHLIHIFCNFWEWSSHHDTVQREQLNASLSDFSSPLCFSDWPRRCCFSQRERRERAWPGSLWWHLISLQDSCNPTLNKRKQQHRSARDASMFSMKAPGSKVAPAVATNQTRFVWRVDIILLWRLLFSWSSLCARIIIFLNRALRSEKCDASQRERSISFSQQNLGQTKVWPAKYWICKAIWRASCLNC